VVINRCWVFRTRSKVLLYFALFSFLGCSLCIFLYTVLFVSINLIGCEDRLWNDLDASGGALNSAPTPTPDKYSTDSGAGYKKQWVVWASKAMSCHVRIITHLVIIRQFYRPEVQQLWIVPVTAIRLKLLLMSRLSITTTRSYSFIFSCQNATKHELGDAINSRLFNESTILR